ncbi:MAG: anti-sigma factor [Ginsengibacter sp.]
MNKNDIISSGLLELYALGLSSPEETLQVEEWVSQYPDIKEEIEAIEMSLESYAQAHAIVPSPLVKNKILSQIAQDEEKNVYTLPSANNRKAQSNVYRIPAFFKLAVAAIFVLLIGSIVLTYSYYTKYESASSDLQVAQQKLEQQNQANLAMKTDINVMTDKNSQPVVLKGTPHAPDALAKIFWMKNTGDVYVDPSNLPATPSGKQYQLWAIVDGKPVDAGMISTEKGIYYIQKMKSFGHAEAFAITLEKAGGSPTPTMDEMFVISKI